MNLNDAEFAYANAVPETGETFHSMEQENSFFNRIRYIILLE